MSTEEEKITNMVKEIKEKVPAAPDSISYQVKYSLFKDENEKIDLKNFDKEKHKTISHVCFSGLLSALDSKNVNRIHVQFDNYNKNTPSEKKQWLRLAKRHGLTPKYIKQTWLKEKSFVLDLNDKNMSPTLLYVYLSTLRNLRDDNSFIKNVIIMTDHGINYFIAFAISSMFYIINGGHHILDLRKQYGSKGITSVEDFKKFHFNIGAAISLKRYIDDPKKWDDRNIFTLLNKSWECHRKIASASKVKREIKGADIFNPAIIDAVMVPTDKESEKCLEKLK